MVREREAVMMRSSVARKECGLHYGRKTLEHGERGVIDLNISTQLDGHHRLSWIKLFICTTTAKVYKQFSPVQRYRPIIHATRSN